MNIFKNYIYQFSFQALSVILPIITTPYVSRVLKPDGVGQYSLATATANYFVLFGILGLNNYGSRQVAYVRDNKEELHNTFWEINILRTCTMGGSILLYLIFTFFCIARDNRTIYLIELITLAASVLDISWLFVGLEEFKKTVSRSIVFKILGVICIFIFVNRKEDLWRYVLILALSTFLGQVVLWFQVPKSMLRIRANTENLKGHFLRSIRLWLPSVAINVYSSLDKIMLGYITNDFQVGLYENSQKLVKIASTVTTSLSTVLVPRMSNLFKRGQAEDFKNLASKATTLVAFISVPICFGIIGIRETLVPWFFGPGYEKITDLLFISAWMVITLGWSSIFGLQILVASNQEKKYTWAVSIAAVINICLNLLLIKRLQAAGAVVSSVIAEYTGMLIMLYFVRKYINLSIMLKETAKYIVGGIVMSSAIFCLGRCMNASMLTTILQICIGVIIYMVMMLILRDKNLIEILGKIRKAISSTFDKSSKERMNP